MVERSSLAVGRAPARLTIGQGEGRRLDVQELAGQEFLLTERGMSYRDALDQCMAAQGLAIKPFLELGSASLLCQMVEHGMGLSFLPEYIVQNALAAGTLSRLNVPALPRGDAAAAVLPQG